MLSNALGTNPGVVEDESATTIPTITPPPARISSTAELPPPSSLISPPPKLLTSTPPPTLAPTPPSTILATTRNLLRAVFEYIGYPRVYRDTQDQLRFEFYYPDLDELEVMREYDTERV
ncbi:hypothetical protein BU26DRAFT_514442 [Trematosphaeria pertusa]|uniref:Uncharacterized protein n=1 Tax=Trematosphaeria pertusa TaxID=390896 RepID=A0A6A6IWZ7_9PLEO|nr:uncharacterized protein BU26DRAFT_514442 [Trematosphaeria pertusa]KAF2254557.1 hypothetical protein BU26DRAFT_514442 [Trematosphaeria pertusa]